MVQRAEDCGSGVQKVVGVNGAGHVFIVTVDHRGTVVDGNAAARRRFGDDAVGARVDQVLGAPALLDAVRAGRCVEALVAGELTVSVMPAGDGAVVVGREPRSRLAGVVHGSADAVVVVGAEGEVLEWNGTASELFGLPAARVVGRPLDEVALRQGATREERAALARVLESGETVRYEAVREAADGRPLDVSVVVSPLHAEDGSVDGAVAVGRDLTALRAAERARDRAAARARFLAEASGLLAGSLDLDRTLASVGALLVPDWADVSVIALRDDADRLEAITVEYPDLSRRGVIEQLFAEHGSRPRPGGLIDRVLATGRPVLAPDYHDPAHDPADPGRRGLRAMGARSLLLAPLRIRGTVIGVLVAVMTDRSGRRFSPEDTDLVQDVADRAAQAIDNARQYRAARAAEERFRAAFEDAPIGVALLHVTDEGTRFAEVNPALCRIFGSRREVLVGRSADDLAAGEQRLVRADGQERWVHVQSAPLTGGEAGGPQAVVAQVQDVTERRRFERQLEHLASHDPLTGVLNRRRFEEELDRALAAVRRHGEPAALVTLDLDDFKHVNDTYGHAIGDELLRVAATALRDRVRATDAVGRLGGDEFGIVLSHTGPDEAARVARGLLEAFRERIGVRVGERLVRVTASAGVRPLDPLGTQTAGEVLGEADMALFDAKEAGRNRLSVAGPGDPVPSAVRHHLHWRERIRDALEQDGFVLYEQPIMGIADGRIDSAELLIRLRTDADPVLPASFLPVAERYDDIRDIDRWVVRHALALLVARQAAGSPVGASVNLSGASLGDASVIDFVVEEIRASGVDPARLTFEVTETTAIGNLERARVLAQQLAELGCGFALDDFGAGFGSFAYLKHLPLDVIKIDGDFIRTLPDSPQDQVTVRAIVDIARGLGKTTVAEFVEDAATLELLRVLGVDRAQGFHIGTPRPATPRPSF